MYKSKASAERAYQGYLGSKYSALLESIDQLETKLAGGPGSGPVHGAKLKDMGSPNKEQFDLLASKGKIHQALGKDLPGEKHVLTPIGWGLVNGYSNADIAHFYLKRRGGHSDSAYQEFKDDLDAEREHLRE